MSTITHERTELPFVQRDGQFWDAFTDNVNALSLEKIIGAIDPRIPVTVLDDYQLVPLEVAGRKDGTLTLEAESSTITLPDHIYTEWDTRSGRPWIDGGVGLGLAYNHDLLAVAAGGLTGSQRLRITQIQGIPLATFHPQMRQRYESGFRSGFSWRHTLVGGMVEIARHEGLAGVEIQGIYHNGYLECAPTDEDDPLEIAEHNEHMLAIATNYDILAQRLGFTALPDRNWLLPLDTTHATQR